MPIPTTYVMPGTGTIASYNWEDLAEGTGIVSLMATPQAAEQWL